MESSHRLVPGVTFAIFLIACIVLADCRARPSPLEQRSAGPPRLLKTDELSAAEKRYGHSATRSTAVTYQADVVLLPDGAEAIRGLSADGLEWTIDPTSRGANDIQPGKVLLLTSRAVGRVLAVEKGSDGLRVVLGPVEITEIIRDGQFSMNQPVDFGNVLSYTSPEVFDPPMPLESLVARLARPDGYGMFVRPAALRQPKPPVTAHRFTLDPFIGTTGVGVRIRSNAPDGVMFVGQAVLYLKAPEVHFVLDISAAKVIRADVELTGVAGLLMEFDAALPRPTDANINENRFVANDFSIPIAGVGGLPLALTVRQQFQLRTAFTSSGALKARGYYTLKGGVRAGYRDGKFSVGGPTGFDAKYTLLPSLTGVAMGATGMILTHQLNVIVGLGAAGFVTGPYAYLNSNVSATHGSSIGAVVCRQEHVAMGVGAGVGYHMPEPVVDAINAVLRALHIREQIKGSGGIETKPVVLVQKGWKHPALGGCG